MNDDNSCYHCGAGLDPKNMVRDIEFHQDGYYCSRECLIQEMKDVECLIQEMKDAEAEFSGDYPNE